jgi:hypothetical protein
VTSSGPRAVGLELRPRHAAALVALIAVAAAALRAMGRPWWCEAGDAVPWSGDVWSRHNSQHLADPYTITHVMHGFLLYALLWLALRGLVAPLVRATLALGVELAWELVENTNWMIERYRVRVGEMLRVVPAPDVAAFVVGYLGATVVPVRVAAIALVVTDALLVLWIRDSLFLNILMLLHPIEAVKSWQMRASP